MSSKKNFFRKVLKNGMTIFLEKRALPVVSVAFAVKAGGVHETLEEKGISHFIEHMLYKGTKKRTAKQIADALERKGADVNGFTSEELTAYWCKIPSKDLDLALDVLSDMIKDSLFDKKEVEKERKVIFEEIKMRHDNPNIYVYDEIQKNLYDGTMKIGISGTIETMNSLSRQDLFDRFIKVYSPTNLILGVVGDCDFEKLISFAEKTFEKEGGCEPLKPIFNRKNEERIEKRKGIDQAHLVFAYHVSNENEKQSCVAEILNCLMADGMSSRLFAEIREKRNLAYAIKGNFEKGKTFSHNLIYVGTTAENVKKVKSLILEEFLKVSQTLTEIELKEIKEQLISQNELSMENSQSQLFNLIGYESTGVATDFYDYKKNVLSVSLKEVKELAKLASKEFSFFALIPE